MEPESFLGKVITFQRNEKDSTCHGCVVGVEGDLLQVVEYAESVEVSTLNNKRRLIAEEDAVIYSLQLKLKRLREECYTRDSSNSSFLEYTLLQWAKKRLREIEKKQWIYLSNLSILPESLRLTFDSVMAIVYNSDTSREWKTVQNIISNNLFIENLCNLDNKPIGKKIYRLILHRYTPHHPFFSCESCTQVSHAVVALQKWVTAFIEYQRVQFFSTDNIEMKQKIDACVNNIRKSQIRRQKLKEELQLVLSGRLLRKLETVQYIPISLCIQVLNGIFSDEKELISYTGKNSFLISSKILEKKKDIKAKNEIITNPYKLVSFSGGFNNKNNEKLLSLYPLCDQLQDDFKRCKFENVLLQQELNKLKSEMLVASKYQIKCKHLEIEMASLREKNMFLVEELSNIKNNVKNNNLILYQQKLKEQENLIEVLELFKNLRGVHKVLIDKYEIMSNFYS